MTDVFLSYNRGDQAVAREIAHGLEAAGYHVWWDTALRAGQTYDEVTEGKLRAARAVVVLWSTRSVKSKWVRAEATMAENRARLVPVMIEECERPLRFELIQTADLVGWSGDRDDTRWRDFLEDLQSFIAETSPPTPPAADEPHTLAEAIVEEEEEERAHAADPEPVIEPEPEPVVIEPEPVVIAAPPVVEPPPAPPPEPPPTPPPPPPPPLAPPEPSPPPPPEPPRVVTPPAPVATPAPTPARTGPAAPSGAPNMAPIVMGAIALGTVLLVGGILMQKKTPDAPPQAEVAVVTPAPTPVSEAPIKTEEKTATPAASGAAFQDCDVCPLMIPLPGRAFLLGSPDSEPMRKPYEGPQQSVTVAPFAMGATEVTFDEWDACVANGGCGGYMPADKGWGRGDRPVISVSWRDAQAYVEWLSRKTGRAYRLPSEAEWEYGARGGATTAFWWGPTYEPRRTPIGRTAPAGGDEANALGLHHVAGNVREWVEDCYAAGFSPAHASGAAIVTGNCSLRVVRGGAWKDRAPEFRVANRGRNPVNTRDSAVGFRVASALTK